MGKGLQISRPAWRHVIQALALGALLVVSGLPLQAQGISLPRPEKQVFNFNDAALEQVAKVLGFVTAQTAVLESIQEQHPALAGQSAARVATFDATYSFPAQRAQWFIQDMVGTEASSQFLASLLQQSRSSIAPLNRARAEEFLAEVDQRIQGQMDEAVFKTMLWLRFAGRPVDEMRDWKQRTSIAGHPKSQGLNMTMDVPLSWRQAEGNRPHIVRKWTSQNGSGTMSFMLLVHDFPGQVTMDDVKEVADSNDWASLIPPGHEVIQGKVVVVDRQPAVEIDASGQGQTLDATVNYLFRTYMIYPKDRMVSLQCYVGFMPDNDRTALEERFSDMKSLCRNMAISITFPDTYK